ncbi:hypothetical protein [Streptomyces chilikensis]|uniref:Peptidase inhibitor family I36 n=1 Tax=Streptomyces chilikensis TaxID=1194079 RepID=A0ABV3EJL6_9ACTN
MKRSPRRAVTGITAAILLTCGLTAEAGASEGPDSLQQQINEVLAATDGGVQISRYEIAWNGGEAIMAFPLPGERHAPPSSTEAVKLQAETAGLSTSATADAVAEAAEQVTGAMADEATPAGEEEPTVGVAATSPDCPTVTIGNDYYCFYQYKNWEGRRLAFSAAYRGYVYFSAYDFVNRTSSWSNKGGKTIYVRGRTESGNDGSCNQYSQNGWTEPAHTNSSSLSASLDNTADCFWTS